MDGGVDECMTIGAMYLLASTIELCMMNDHITSVAFSNKR